MFPRSTPSLLTRRARNALSLARSFLLLEDDYDVDWEVDLDEFGRGDARGWNPGPHPHRTALRSRSARVRAGQTAQSAQVCVCPVERPAMATAQRTTLTNTGRPQATRM